MQTTKGHAPIEVVLEAAGIDIPAAPQSPKRTESMHGGSESLNVRDSAMRRHTSLRGLTEASSRRATLIRRGDDGSSSTYSTVIMSREEEETWMAERQQQLEALHARKLMRRGVLDRVSKTSGLTADESGQSKLMQEGRVLEPVGEMSEDLMEEMEANGTNRRDSVDTAGGDADDEDDDDTLEEDQKSQNDILMEEINQRLHSMTNLTDHRSADGENLDDDVLHPNFTVSATERGLSSKEDHDWPIPPSHTPFPRDTSL